MVNSEKKYSRIKKRYHIEKRKSVEDDYCDSGSTNEIRVFIYIREKKQETDTIKL